MSDSLKIGTRGSDLALWQARFLQSELARIGLTAELHIIKTQGDRVQHLGFDKLEGKGFFTKELEEALLAGTVDIAVHSMKDLPTESPTGLVIAAVSHRENAADWLLIRPDFFDASQPLRLKPGSTVGTSAVRRKALLQSLQPDLKTEDLRGNVPTRVEKLRQGQCDAIILAAAGLERLALDISDLKLHPLMPREFIPAPAQGVLAYQILADNVLLRRQLTALHHPEVSSCTNIERRVLQLLGGGCHLPLGVHCERDQNGYYHCFAAFSPDIDAPIIRTRISSSTTFQLAETIAKALQFPEAP